MKFINILLIIFFAAMGFSCEKDLDIIDFKDEFGNYRPELKIEGLLQQNKPEDSIIRIISTGTVTDTDIFNGIDDDGDGDIDEEDEILPLIEERSATVSVTNLNSGVKTDFQYFAMADSVVRRDSNDVVIVIPYGGYKPVSPNFQIENYAQYQLDVYSPAFDQTISAVTTVYPPVAFIDTLFAFNGNRVTMKARDNKEIFWKSDLDLTAFYITAEELLATGSGEYEFLYSYETSRDVDLTDIYKTASIGKGLIFGVDYQTELRITVAAMSPEWGRYMFSSLPLKDPQRSNLRDANGNPVMGCFGATAADTLFINIEE